MGRKSKIPGFQKIEVIEKYLRGEDSLNNLAKELDISWTSAKQWLDDFKICNFQYSSRSI